jgi:hypothetical protein
MRAFTRLACLLCASLCLAACAPVLSLVGTNQTLVQVTAQAERVKLAGDGASYAASSKTITDHALSKAVNKDCRLFNVTTRKPVCADKPAAPTVVADANANAVIGTPASAAQPAPAENPESRTEPSTPSQVAGSSVAE